MFSCMLGHPCIRAQETAWQSDMQLCTMPGLLHLVQELNVGIVHVHRLYMYMCDISMLNMYGYGIYILETNSVPLKI